MAFDKKSFNEIYASMVEATRARMPALTDFEEGSVIRSLYESFAYEIALFYEQLDVVYQAGFVDTASGPNLDRVVAVLGIRRNEPDFASGSVTFQRDPGSQQEVVIPIGTQVATEEDPRATPSKKTYVTIEEARLAPEAVSVEVRVRAEERGKQLSADRETIVVMPRPVPGVKAVVNQEPIRFLGRDRESDDELRARAKQTLLASGRASSSAIESALFSLPGVREVRVRESFGSGDDGQPALNPGEIEVYVDGLSSQNELAVRRRLDEVRAAGVYAMLKPAVAINVEAVLRIEVDGRIGGEERAQLEQRVRDAVETYLQRLRMGESLLFSQLTGEVFKVSGVVDVADFQLVTYRQSEMAAQGTVTLARPMAAAVRVELQAGTLLRSSAGPEFMLVRPEVLEQNQERAEVAVQAIRPGRAGELPIATSDWQPLSVDGAELTVSNGKPLLFQRSRFGANDKARRIDLAIYERFIPALIRVAAEQKPLPMYVLVRLFEPGTERDSKRLKIEEAVQQFFAALPESGTGAPFPKTELESKIRALHRKGFELRLVAFPFQGEDPQEDLAIEVALVDRPRLDLVFVYTDRLELTGALRLVLPLTATRDEKQRATLAARQAIGRYLEGLRPEEDVDLAQLPRLAMVEQVLRVEFQARDCGVVRVESGGPVVLAGRVDGSSVDVEPFEKVFLSPDRFIVEA